jgi:hypothetical protein
MISDGVKMTLSFCCPAVGAVVAAVHANVPLTEAVPPVSVDNASDWPTELHSPARTGNEASS